MLHSQNPAAAFEPLGVPAHHDAHQCSGYNQSREQTDHDADSQCNGKSLHAHVRIDDDDYRQLKAYLVDLSPQRPISALVEEIRAIPFEPYHAVYQQMKHIVRAMNRTRKHRGLRDRVRYSDIRWKRWYGSPFVSEP